MKLLQATSLTKKFKNKTAVNGINLTINKGDFVAFLGPNGAGKSTTINMLTGIIQPTSGMIDFYGKSTTNRDYRNKIGVVFQSSVLDNNLSVKDNIMTRAKMYHKPTQIQLLINKFDLESIWKQKYGSLSGGQRRRVDIARALVNSPELLFLDEPSTGLDVRTRTAIWTVLNQLRRDTGLTIVLTTHYLEETQTADYVYIIDQGKIIAENTVNKLQKQYTQNILTLYYPNGESKKLSVNDKDHAIEILSKNSQAISDFEYRPGTMNDVFMNLTGKEIH
ncbi:ABC transporter ATP-binding protein [Companilactobacillus jidongensis]|uniref:ABC transporter ATP-binding protein n=1 Tax=Companilactobacillus jidongensis TaxID=2486006 RepID=UPI000F771E58|nr:ABC transporter ATP-binding protein [Companilactobacillus jidongensis]